MGAVARSEAFSHAGPPDRDCDLPLIDIEGSSKLWEQYPAAMPQVLARSVWASSWKGSKHCSS